MTDVTATYPLGLAFQLRPPPLQISKVDERSKQSKASLKGKAPSQEDNMDQILKAQKMSSASARRKRIQDRMDEQDLATRQYQEHKRRIVIYDDGLEDHDISDDEHDSVEKIDLFQRHREWSLDTASDHSMLTPDDPNAVISLYSKQNLAEPTRTTPIVHSDLVHDHEEDPHENLAEASQPFLQASPVPTLQASLVALSDFTYDRFSMIMDSPPGLVSSPEFDSDSSSSIETATPVSYRLPVTRPSVISITTSKRKSKRRNVVSAQSPLAQPEDVPSPPARSRKRMSTASMFPAFLASEATPFEVPGLPANAVKIIANASKESLGTYVSEKADSIKQRKPSIPFLSGTLKTGQDKMNSIKNFVKAPSQSNGQSLFRPSSGHHRSLTAASKNFRDIPSVDPLPSFTSSRFPSIANLTRPQTARSTSTSGSREPSVTALPVATSSSLEETSEMTDETREVYRKKSFSMLRRRSGSLGQAIKQVKSKASKSSPTSDTTPEVPVPPTSFLMSPDSIQSVDLSNFPSPPIPSPRSRKSVMSFSYLPTVRNSGSGPIGLGLKG